MATSDSGIVSRVSQLSCEELEQVRTVAEAFAREAPTCREFSWPIALNNWKQFYAQGIATIFALWDDERIVGALAGFVYPDVNDGQLRATEFFWYVLAAYRGSGEAQTLVDRFERWARERGATHTIMASLEGMHEKALDRYYLRRGYQRLDHTYIKELQ